MDEESGILTDKNSDLREKEYFDFPILMERDIPRGWGFVSDYCDACIDSEPLFVDALSKVLADPEWVNRRGWILEPENKARLDEIALLDINRRRELAKSINSLIERGRLGFEPTPLVAEALSVMTRGYPNYNLSFFRGARFEPGQSFQGSDFAPGDFLNSLGYLFNVRGVGRKRKDPLLVVISFQEVAKAYFDRKIIINTEGDWWRGSMMIRAAKGFLADSVKTVVYRLPSDEHELSLLEERYQDLAIRVSPARRREPNQVV